MNAHADMLIVVSTQRIKHTKGHLPLSCFGVRSLLDFVVPKQAPINAFYYVCKAAERQVNIVQHRSE